MSAEERKRWNSMTPKDRWRLWQRAVQWADAQQPVSHSHPKTRKAHEHALLAALGER